MNKHVVLRFPSRATNISMPQTRTYDRTALCLAATEQDRVADEQNLIMQEIADRGARACAARIEQRINERVAFAIVMLGLALVAGVCGACSALVTR